MPKFKQLVLTELGETTDAYRYEFLGNLHGDVVEWKFKTPNQTYYVIIKQVMDYLDVEFETEKTGMDATNEGNQFRVMATVLKISKEAWKRREELFDSYVDKIKYYPSDTSDEKSGGFEGRNKRDKLYQTFIKRQFPNAKIEGDKHSTTVMPAQMS